MPVTDLIVKDNDVVVSTQGRSFWSDDVSPLRQASAAITSGDAFLFKPRPRTASAPPGPRRGQNSPYGAIVYYWLKAEPKDKEEVTLEILDGAGKLVRKISSKGEDPRRRRPRMTTTAAPGRRAAQAPGQGGMNRFAWNLRHADATRFKNSSRGRAHAGPARSAGRVPGAPDRERQGAHGVARSAPGPAPVRDAGRSRSAAGRCRCRSATS